MTTESRELFELCKQVYEATGLADTIDYFYLKNNGDYNVDRANHTQVDHNWWKLGGEVPARCFPLYTSDYLLEKLPVHLKEGTLSSLYELDEDGRPWCWGYHYDDKRVKLTNGCYAQGWADTPLKALLNLVIKLDKGGVKL